MTQEWGPNLALFEERLGNPGVKDRVENMYFTYLFVMRAIQKAGPMLDRLDYDTGMPAADQQTRELVHQLVRLNPMPFACDPFFCSTPLRCSRPLLCFELVSE